MACIASLIPLSSFKMRWLPYIVLILIYLYTFYYTLSLVGDITHYSLLQWQTKQLCHISVVFLRQCFQMISCSR